MAIIVAQERCQTADGPWTTLCRTACSIEGEFASQISAGTRSIGRVGHHILEYQAIRNYLQCMDLHNLRNSEQDQKLGQTECVLRCMVR